MMTLMSDYYNKMADNVNTNVGYCRNSGTGKGTFRYEVRQDCKDLYSENTATSTG